FKISKQKQGPLGALTIFIGGILGALSGSGTATSAALGQIAVPELKRRGYHEGLAGTLAASAGSLSAIIPPSIFLIIYGVVAQVSIGELFVAAMIPGFLVMAIFVLITLVLLKNNKSSIEIASTTDEEDSTPTKQYVVSISLAVIVMATVFG